MGMYHTSTFIIRFEGFWFYKYTTANRSPLLTFTNRWSYCKEAKIQFLKYFLKYHTEGYFKLRNKSTKLYYSFPILKVLEAKNDFLCWVRKLDHHNGWSLILYKSSTVWRCTKCMPRSYMEWTLNGGTPGERANGVCRGRHTWDTVLQWRSGCTMVVFVPYLLTTHL